MEVSWEEQAGVRGVSSPSGLGARGLPGFSEWLKKNGMFWQARGWLSQKRSFRGCVNIPGLL